MAEVEAPTTEPLASELPRRRKDVQRRVLRWTRGSRREYPWREPGRTPYEILVAEFLLKRTTATAAARVFPDFIARYPSVEALAAAKRADLEAALRTVGLQAQRAQALKELASYLTRNEGGRIPKENARLSAVPGVGPYTVAALRSFAFGEPDAIVDSNVERIVRRLFAKCLNGTPSHRLTRTIAQRLLPPRKHREFNYGLLDLGALVCRYARPRCTGCPLAAVCDFSQEPPN